MAIAADSSGWAAITNAGWYPSIFFIALGVALWIAAFDLNYARMDMESDRANGIKSFPSRFGDAVTTRTSVQLTLAWFACFAISNPMSEAYFLAAAGAMAVVNILVIVRMDRWVDFQTTLFRASMLTGWVLLAAIIAMDPSKFGNAAAWSDDAEVLFDDLHAIEGTRLPGARRQSHRSGALADGVDVNDALMETLENLAA